MYKQKDQQLYQGCHSNLMSQIPDIPDITLAV